MIRKMSLVFCIALVLTCTHTAFAGQWFKGGMHMHSLWSDGDAAPEIVASWYKDHGWNFICYSDHNILLEGDTSKPIMEDANLSPQCVEAIREQFGEGWVQEKEHLGRKRMQLKKCEELKPYFDEPGRFLIIQGEEITTLGENPHVGAINVVERTGGLPKGDKTSLINQYMASVAEQSKRHDVPMITILNHPNFSDGITVEQALAVKPLRFFEVYNGHPSVHNWGHEGKSYPSTDRFWDIILSLRLADEPSYVLYGIGTDDAHNYLNIGKGANPGRGWVMVQAEALNAEALIASMQRGDFYTSTGIVLDNIQRNETGLTFDIEAEADVIYTTQFLGTRKGFDKESNVVLDNNGAPKPGASNTYSDDIGVVLAETTDVSPAYEFKGGEMYVRAKVTSNKLHPNPFKEGDYEMAWVQPAIAP